MNDYRYLDQKRLKVFLYLLDDVFVHTSWLFLFSHEVCVLFLPTNLTNIHEYSYIAIARMNCHPEESTSIAREDSCRFVSISGNIIHRWLVRALSSPTRLIVLPHEYHEYPQILIHRYCSYESPSGGKHKRSA